MTLAGGSFGRGARIHGPGPDHRAFGRVKRESGPSSCDAPELQPFGVRSVAETVALLTGWATTPTKEDTWS